MRRHLVLPTQLIHVMESHVQILIIAISFLDKYIAGRGSWRLLSGNRAKVQGEDVEDPQWIALDRVDLLCQCHQIHSINQLGSPMARSLDEVLASVPKDDRWKLDKEIDFEHSNAPNDVTTVPKHLGKIADSMTGWEGAIADHLGLSEADRNDIRERNSREPKLQR